MRKVIDDYHKTSSSSAYPTGGLGKPGAREEALLTRFAELAKERILALGHAGLLTSNEWTLENYAPTLTVRINFHDRWAISRRAHFQLFPEKRKPYQDKVFVSFSCLARQAQLAVVGEDRFLELQWKRFAKVFLALDEALRQDYHLPKPSGSTSRSERQNLEESLSASPSSPGPKRPSL